MMKTAEKVVCLEKAVRAVFTANINKKFIRTALAEKKTIPPNHMENFLFSLLWQATVGVPPTRVDTHTLCGVVSAIKKSAAPYEDPHPWQVFAETGELPYGFRATKAEPVWEGYWQ